MGGARIGQKALFSVEAYPDKFFQGEVNQVRQAPITVQNVVTYDVVISVSNPDFQLLPGMTANTRIITDKHDHVLHVPVQALRFSLPEQERNSHEITGADKPHDQGVYVVRDGIPVRFPVTVGLNDGTNVEISGAGIKAGDEVITNEIKPDDGKTGAAPQRSLLRF